MNKDIKRDPPESGEKKERKESKSAAVALCLDVASVLLFAVGRGFFSIGGNMWGIGLLCSLAAVLLPLGAIVTGIFALFDKETGKKGKIMAAVAVAVPVVAVVTVILLFSTGVAVIRWM